MATIVENTIVYDSGVNIIGSGSTAFLPESSNYADPVDDREEKIKLFRALLNKDTEPIITSYNLSEIQGPVGLDDHLPVPNLETSPDYVSASDVFNDMMQCGKDKTKTQHEIYQEKMETLKKEKKEILEQASTILNETKSDEAPEAYDESATTAESIDSVPSLPKSDDKEGWSWFAPSLPESTRNTHRGIAAAAPFPETVLDQCAQKYKGIKVFQSNDDYGRTFFMLDDGIRQHLMLVVFEVQGTSMVSINDVVMQLDYFLSMSQAMEDKEDKTGRPIVRLRLGHELLEIPDTSVAMIMMALTILDRHQKGEKILTEDQQDTDGNDWRGLFEWSVIGIMAGTILLQYFMSSGKTACA